MERENEQITEVCEQCGRPLVKPDASDLRDAEVIGVRPPALMEFTTPGGRVWFIANLN